MQNKISVKKRLFSVLLLFSILFPLFPKPAEAIEPWGAEFYALGKPGAKSIGFDELDGRDTSIGKEMALREGKLYISTLNMPFHTYTKGSVRYAEVNNWDGVVRTEKVTPNSVHKVQFKIPMPPGCKLLDASNLFVRGSGNFHPDDALLVPEKWVSYLPNKEKAKEYYSKHQARMALDPSMNLGGLENSLMMKSKNIKTEPGYAVLEDAVLLNVYLKFMEDGGTSEEAYEQAENTTRILKDLREEYLRVENLKGTPKYAEKKAEIDQRIAEYAEKVGPEAFKVQGPYITTGKMAGKSKLEGQLAYYSNPTIFFTPIEDCDAYVHKYYYVKQGETETLENYIWQPYKKEQGYTVKNEGAYKVVAYHTITDETACKPEPNLPDYETTVPLFNGSAKGTGPGVLPKEKTLQPAPKGSEIAIKLLREEEVPQEPPKDTVLELTQKRISRRFDLTPWKKDGEDKPLTLTYTWPSVPPCVCEQCDADSPCVNFCFSTVEPSMTFLIKQINTLNRQLVADGEYFKAYEEDNTAQVARGDKAGKHDIKPNYHFVIYRGKDMPTLASYKYRTEEAKQKAAPLYTHLLGSMGKVPANARYGLSDPSYDKEENKGIIYEDALTLTFGGVKNWYYMVEDLQTTAERSSCSGRSIYVNQFGVRPAPKDLNARVYVHCYYGLPNEGVSVERSVDGTKADQNGMFIDGVAFKNVWGKYSNDHKIQFYPYVEMVYDSTGFVSPELADKIFEENVENRDKLEEKKDDRELELKDIIPRINAYEEYTLKVLLPEYLNKNFGLSVPELPEKEKKALQENAQPFKYNPLALEVAFSKELREAYAAWSSAHPKDKNQYWNRFMDLVDAEPRKIRDKYDLKRERKDIIFGEMVRDLNKDMEERMKDIKSRVERKTDEPVLTLAGHQSTYKGRHYVETGYLKTPLSKSDSGARADSGLQILSQQWSTHERASKLGPKNTVLPGGAIYRLLTPEEGAGTSWKDTTRTRFGVSYYLTYVPDDVIGALSGEGKNLTLEAATKAVFGSNDINGTSGSASSIYKGLNSIDIVQAMGSGLSGPSVPPYGGVLVDQKQAGSQTAHGNQRTSKDQKYWLDQMKVQADLDESGHKGAGGISKEVNRADLDILEVKTYEAHCRIYAQVDGTVVFGVAKNKEALKLNDYNSPKPLFVGPVNQVSISRNQGADAMIAAVNSLGASIGKGPKFGEILDKKTNMITGFIGSIDRNKGHDETRPSMSNGNIKGANSIKWYDEGWDGISLVMYDKVYVLGFRDQAPAGIQNAKGKFRTAVIDPKLSKANVGQASSYTSAVKSWFQSKDTSDAYPGAIGKVGEIAFPGDGGAKDVHINNMGGLYKSKDINIPNATTMNTLN